MMKEHKHKTVMIVSLIMLALALTLFYLLLISHFVGKKTNANLNASGLQNALLIRQNIESHLEKLELVSKELAPVYHKGSEPCTDKCSHMAEQLGYANLGIVLYTGGTFCSSAEAPLGAAYEHLMRDKDAGWKNQRGDIISALVNDGADTALFNVYAVPFLVDGTEIGFLYGMTNGATPTPAGTQPFFVVDREGGVVYMTGYEESAFGSGSSQERRLKEIKAEVGPLVEAFDRDPTADAVYEMGGRKLVFSKMNMNGWYVVSLFENSAVDGQIFALSVIACAVSFAMFLGLCCLFHRTWLKNQKRLLAFIQTDELTGALNFKGFETAVRELLDEAPVNVKYAVVDFDVNSFEAYNSLYGFEAGNLLLCSMADAIKETIGENELYARVSADHFVCLVKKEQTGSLLERIYRAEKAFRRIKDCSRILVSYGIYEITDRSLPISTMCDRALAAKRTIKGNFNNIIAVYDEEFHRKQLEDIEMVSYMETALQKGEFVAYYQPKYNIATEGIVGLEALARWKHPKGEIRPPDRFIRLFEKNGLIGRLDLYMFETVCSKLSSMLRVNNDPVPISVNFSRTHLYDPDFANKLLETTRKYGVSPGLLEIELTESAFLSDQNKLLAVISELHNMGFLVSVDDFGSGYSSLNLIKDINFDIIKLDRAFLSTSNTERGKTVVKFVLTLAHALKLQIVAEGVETDSQLEFLRNNGCDIVQGFLFSRPLPEEELDRLLGISNENGMEREPVPAI